MKASLFLLCLLAFASALTEVHDVIIIGAGLAGVSASKVLTQNNIPHLMLEARNRTGGRIQGAYFEGIAVDVGASYVHQPNNSNPIAQLMLQLNWTALPTKGQRQAYYYDSPQVIKHRMADQAANFKDMMIAHMVFKAKMAEHDLSIQDASKDFFKHILDKELPIFRDICYWWLRLYGSSEGGQIHQLSARQYQYDQTNFDMMPTGGFWFFFKEIFKKCKPTLKYNEVVTEIDYSKPIVKVTTNQGVYFAKKVINSIPLGILKRGDVHFIPKLPSSISTAFEQIEEGTQNKLIVSFQEAFWEKHNASWLYFVKKNKQKGLTQCAFVLPHQEKNIAMFFLSGTENRRVDDLSAQALKAEILQFLRPFTKKQPKIKALLLTKWHLDPFSRGSYTYYRVGGSRTKVQKLREPIDNKLWFVGEHTHPQLKSLTQAAFITGRRAAYQVINEKSSMIDLETFE